jgi:hypothetical protein
MHTENIDTYCHTEEIALGPVPTGTLSPYNVPPSPHFRDNAAFTVG